MQRERFSLSFSHGGAVVGLGYVVLPISIPACPAALHYFVTGTLRPEYTFYLLLFILVEEMVQYFITYAPVIVGSIPNCSSSGNCDRVFDRENCEKNRSCANADRYPAAHGPFL
jgi:hypothetical protein